MAKGDLTARFHKGHFTAIPDEEGVPMIKFVGECRREMEAENGEKADLGGCVKRLHLPRAEFDALIAKMIVEIKKDDQFKDLKIS